jgi:putative endonuclease
MYTVYVLYSALFDNIYIGYTSDLEERLRAHNELSHKGWTRKFRPWILVYSEVVENKTDALKREKSLKSSRGRNFIRNLIKKQSGKG